MLSWCLMSSDVIWHIRDKLWPMPKHGSIRKVYACLAVTCHLHFWQNDRDFLRATVVTRGWNGYWNKSQHRKSTLEKKILPPFQQGFEPATFQSRVRRSNHWAIPAPYICDGYSFTQIVLQTVTFGWCSFPFTGHKTPTYLLTPFLSKNLQTKKSCQEAQVKAKFKESGRTGTAILWTAYQWIPYKS